MSLQLTNVSQSSAWDLKNPVTRLRTLAYEHTKNTEEVAANR